MTDKSMDKEMHRPKRRFVKTAHSEGQAISRGDMLALARRKAGTGTGSLHGMHFHISTLWVTKLQVDIMP